METYTVCREYWKTVEVEANSAEEALKKVREENLFDDVELQGYNDEII